MFGTLICFCFWNEWDQHPGIPSRFYQQPTVFFNRFQILIVYFNIIPVKTQKSLQKLEFTKFVFFNTKKILAFFIARKCCVLADSILCLPVFSCCITNQRRYTQFSVKLYTYNVYWVCSWFWEVLAQPPLSFFSCFFYYLFYVV